ncbi:hypothetical protein [Streptomyces sp. NPDC093094]|uniref:hypothetical protein n=1 Tax=Streptomyces sp. NPDC093094 TaxID=3366026 RepID=UPI00382C79D9
MWCVGVFLCDVHRCEWQPDLAGGVFVCGDAPEPRALEPRFIAERLMWHLEAPEAGEQGGS